MKTARQLKELCDAGTNILSLSRDGDPEAANQEGTIEIAYDLQAGSYVAAMSVPKTRQVKDAYTKLVADEIRKSGVPQSVMEAGVGEATTLSEVARELSNPDTHFYGFDISWSRIAEAQKWVSSRDVKNVSLCVASMTHLPYADRSIDVVYTSHSIEPNGGNEEPILRELLRVTRKTLILLEPGYELAGPEARARMDSFGYCKDLPRVIESLGHAVDSHTLFPITLNPLNPTAMTVVHRRDSIADAPQSPLACPRHKTPLQQHANGYFSPEALRVYPTVEGIPCLRVEHGILASGVSI